MNMDIFSQGFDPSSDIEKKLEAIYVPMFQTMRGMTLTQAKSTFSDIIKKAKEESLKEGTSKFPQNLGDILLENESTNPHFKSMLAKKRSENVRDEDIRWWWNMHDLERRMMTEDDGLIRFAYFLYLKDNGLSAEEAGKRVKKSYPILAILTTAAPPLERIGLCHLSLRIE